MMLLHRFLMAPDSAVTVLNREIMVAMGIVYRDFARFGAHSVQMS